MALYVFLRSSLRKLSTSWYLSLLAGADIGKTGWEPSVYILLLAPLMAPLTRGNPHETFHYLARLDSEVRSREDNRQGLLLLALSGIIQRI